MAEYFYNQMLRRKCHQKKNPLQKFKKAFDKALFFFIFFEINIISILFIRHNKLIRLRKKSRSTEKTY